MSDEQENVVNFHARLSNGLGEDLDEDQVGAGPEVQDIDASEWLDVDESQITGYVPVRVGNQDRRLKIAALTEAETNRLLKASRHKMPSGKTSIDLPLSKLLMIAYSLNKASGHVAETGQLLPGAIVHTQLNKKLGGRLTTIYRAIAELSGFESDSDKEVGGFFD